MTEETEQQSQEHEFGPGALLKRTREQQGLSLEEVSTRLKLTLPVLKNIENDDYEGGLPVTFYRGYLKNYAELLDVEDVDICANFQQYCKQNNLFSTPPPRLQGLELDKPVTSSNWWFKAVTGLIILALVAAIYYMVVEKELWKKLVPSNGDTEAVSSELSETGADLDSNGLPLGQAAVGDSEQSLSESQVANTEQTLDNTSELNQQGTTDSAGSLSLSGNEFIDDESTGDEAIGDEAIGDESISTEPVDSSQRQVAQPQSSASDAQLMLTFSDDCWIRIEDATGKVLALGIKSGGTDLQLSGQAPYSLTLGKASAVQLTYDGEAVDLSQYPDTRAAKLTLGDS